MTPSQKRRAKRRKHLQRQPKEGRIVRLDGRLQFRELAPEKRREVRS